MLTPFSDAVIKVIKSIPPGKVSSYGRVAAEAAILAGLSEKSGSGARQVARLLHSSSKKYALPWHRVINSRGYISLPFPESEEQKALLLSEGIKFLPGDRVDFEKFGWNTRH